MRYIFLIIFYTATYVYSIEIKQNISSKNSFIYNLKYTDSAESNNFTISISSGFEEFLKDDIKDSDKYPYTFEVYNLNDIITISTELNRALTIMLDTTDAFEFSAVQSILYHIQLAKNVESKAQIPQSGKMLIYNKPTDSILVKFKPDSYFESIEETDTLNLILVKSYRQHLTGLYNIENSSSKYESSGNNYSNLLKDIKDLHQKIEDKNKLKISIVDLFSQSEDYIMNDLKNINKELKKFFKENVDYKTYKLPFSSNNSQIVFENGSIVDIKIILNNEDNKISEYNKDEDIIFTNKIPIGFSSKNNYQEINNHYLFDLKYNRYKIKLSDVLHYDPNLNLFTRDYSPADTVLNINKDSDSIYLIKKRSTHLLNIEMYSDFIGIGQNKANGLIQTEIDYRLNTNTTHRQIGKTWSSVGFFTYILPYFAVTKIEENGKDLILSKENLDKTKKGLPYAERLSFLEYNKFKAGLHINYIETMLPKYKFNFELNGSFDFGRTAVSMQDDYVDTNSNRFTIKNNLNISTISIRPIITKFVFLPEERFQFELKYSLGFLFILSDNVETVYNSKKLEKDKDIKNALQSMYHTIELKAKYKIQNIGFLFARYRLNFQNNIKAANFHQAQVGISLNMLELFNRN